MQGGLKMGERADRFKLSVERKMIGAPLDNFLKNKQSDEDRRMFYSKVLKMGESVFGGGKNQEKIDLIKAAIDDPDNRWVNYINDVIDDTDPVYFKKFVLNAYNAFFLGTRKIRSNREKYGCNIPWLILFDPTSACNMHCKGCWSGTYGKKNNLSFEDMDKIVTEGKELGVFLYMMTGGEPLVRKADILKLAEKHNDCIFAMYTNSTLIDQTLCEKVKELGNISFLLSIEGTKETNDFRRGDGHYDAVINAMELLKKNGILFGTSICYTRENIEAVTDEAFIKYISSMGARFGFYFHYMPIGKNAVPELMPTPEQRRMMIDKIRYYRSRESDVRFFPMDFQNDGEYVGGCIAGGRNYFHINAAGDAEPCVFIHFSDSNIHEKSILETLQSPLFMSYHEGQPFNRNHLMPCPMLENPQYLRRMAAATGAKGTNEEAEETAEELCAKCDAYSESWRPVAKEIWESRPHVETQYKNYSIEKTLNPTLEGFQHADHTDEIKSIK